MLKSSLCLLFLFPGLCFADDPWVTFCRVSPYPATKNEQGKNTDDYVLDYKILEGEVLIGHSDESEDLRDYLDDLEEYESENFPTSIFQAGYAVIFGTTDDGYEDYIVDSSLQKILSPSSKVTALKPDNPIMPIIKSYIDSIQ